MRVFTHSGLTLQINNLRHPTLKQLLGIVGCHRSIIKVSRHRVGDI